MPSRQVVISVHDGLHARPVAELARIALAHAEPVFLTTADGVTVEVGSILAVMDLGLTTGDEVSLDTGDSVAAESVLDNLAAVLDPSV